MDNRPSPWHSPQPNETDEDKSKRASNLYMETASVEQRQGSWHTLNLWCATLYTNRELPGFRWGEPVADYELQPTDLRTENILELIGESFLSKAASSPLKPSIIPRGNKLETERAARVLDNFLFGCWRQTEAEEACIQMFLDAYISGIGCVQTSYNAGKKQLHVESVFFDNLVIDNRECAGRKQPRTYRIRRVLPRATVEARYPGVKLGPQQTYVDYRRVAEGWAVVIEAWRLPDDDGSGGYHMIACENQICMEEQWKYDWVPLTFFHWTDAPDGFIGRKGGIEQLLPFQNRQNDLNTAIEKTIDIVCVPRLLANANSLLDVNTLDNEFGRVWLYAGQEPKPFEWRTDLSTLLNERVRNRSLAFSQVGMSEQFASADLPQQVRLDSSAGIREFHNMEDRRNLRRWSRFEKARMEVAKNMLRVLGMEQGAEGFSTFYYTGGSKANATEIPYEAVKDLTEDDYSWSMEPTPLAALSPAARRELIRDWSSRGLLTDQNEARRMEGNPALERIEDLEMASKEDIDLRVLRILEAGDYEAPTRMTNVTYGIPAVIANFHRLKKYEDIKPNDKRLANHVRWVVQAVAVQKQLALEAQQLAQPEQQPTPFSPTQGMPGTNSSNGPPMIFQGAPQ